MKYLLTAAVNDETGELGWRDSRVPRNSTIYGPLTAQGIAHDVVEHFAFDSVADEMQAHGATFYNRTECLGEPLNLEYDFEGLVRALMQEPYLPKVPRVEELDNYIEISIQQILEMGKIFVRELDAEENIRKILESYAPHFRIGYRRAKKRGPNCGYVYQQIRKLRNPEFEGQVIKLNVDYKTGSFNYSEYYETEY